MPARRRELKPDSKGRYRPYLGYRMDDEGINRQYSERETAPQS